MTFRLMARIKWNKLWAKVSLWIFSFQLFFNLMDCNKIFILIPVESSPKAWRVTAQTVKITSNFIMTFPFPKIKVDLNRGDRAGYWRFFFLWLSIYVIQGWSLSFRGNQREDKKQRRNKRSVQPNLRVSLPTWVLTNILFIWFLILLFG